MARAKPKPNEPEGDEAATALPAWKQQSVERSLQAARVKAQERTDTLVAATMELMQERGSTDFTVQEVVEHARMSIRTFDNFFQSKDDLHVAVHETTLAREVAPRLRHRCEKERDPVLRVKAYIDGIYGLTAAPTPAFRALTTYRNRLAETRPEDLEQAFKPLVDLIEELLVDVQAKGKLTARLSTRSAALLVQQTVLAAVHARILAPEGAETISAEDLWTFCASGIGVDPGGPRGR
jgi:AcrR family transcriptional regulator